MKEDRRPKLKEHVKRANAILENVSSINTKRLAPALNKLLGPTPKQHPYLIIGSLLKIIKSNQLKGDFKKRCYAEGAYFCKKNKVKLIPTYSLKSHRNRLNKTIKVLNEKYQKNPQLLMDPITYDYDEENYAS